MNLNEHLQQAYNAGIRQGLNEQGMEPFDPMAGAGGDAVDAVMGQPNVRDGVIEINWTHILYPDLNNDGVYNGDDGFNFGMGPPYEIEPDVLEYPDGTILTPGTITFPNGTIVGDNGDIFHPNGTITFDNGDFWDGRHLHKASNTV